MIQTLALLLFLSPALQAPWGVSMGESKDTLIGVFKPAGDAKTANWTREKKGEIEVFSYGCPPSSGCFSAPSAAQFHFVDGELSAATLSFRQEQSPEGVNINLLVRATLSVAGFTETLASHSAVGRKTRYLHQGGQTLVWVQDGPDIDLKLYRDAKSPVGRAEAVVAGASLSLAGYPGAAEYSAAHRAILGRKFRDAERSLNKVIKTPAVSPLLMREARYVLAMVIAADVKTSIDGVGFGSSEARDRASSRLARAQELAPSLAEHLQALRQELKRQGVQQIDE